MATSSVTSTSATTSAADLAATNKANAQAIMTSLGAGSGVNVTTLAQSLTDAEGLPQKTVINSKIAKNDTKVTGLSAVMFMMTELKTKLSALKDRDSFNTVSASNSNASSFNVTASSSAAVGTHQVKVTSLSDAQRTISKGFTSKAEPLNAGNPFSFTIANTNTAGVSVGTSTSNGIYTASVDAPTFGTSPSVNDFKNFYIDIDGKTINLTPVPATATLADLAANLQSQLRGIDGTTDLSVTVESGVNLVFTSATTTRVLDNPTLSKSTTFNLESGASGGTTTDNLISGVAFGTTPSINDFGGFTLTVDGTTRSIIPAPTSPTLDSLASSIQSQLRLLDSSNDMSVTVTDGTLSFSSLSGRTLTNIALTENTFDDTPEGMVAAINSANRGYKAQLIDDGSASPYKIMITGESGSTESFSLSSASAVALDFTNMTEATDAKLTVDGVAYIRKSNSITDIVKGLTLDLQATSATVATVMVNRYMSTIQTKLNELVTAYNDFSNIITETTDPKSTLETYGASLVGNSTVRMVKQQMRAILLGNSSTAGTSIKNLSQLGLSLDEKGVMSLNSTKLNTVLASNFDDVTKLFTGGFNNLSSFSTQNAGIAGDAVRKLTNLLSKTGPLISQSDGANTRNDKYRTDLTKLQTRLDAILARYTKQFAAMDSFVGSINSQKTSLKATFDGMMASYTNK